MAYSFEISTIFPFYFDKTSWNCIAMVERCSATFEISFSQWYIGFFFFFFSSNLGKKKNTLKNQMKKLTKAGYYIRQRCMQNCGASSTSPRCFNAVWPLTRVLLRRCASGLIRIRRGNNLVMSLSSTNDTRRYCWHRCEINFKSCLQFKIVYLLVCFVVCLFFFFYNDFVPET